MFDNDYNINITKENWESAQRIFQNNFIDRLFFTSPLFKNILKVDNIEKFDILDDLNYIHKYVQKYLNINFMNNIYILFEFSLICGLCIFHINANIREDINFITNILMIIGYLGILPIINKYIIKQIHKEYLKNILYKIIYLLLKSK